uniref:Uncharacterized protein n=1 Tax=Arundo donax TaxID=35708 RepID=A0A0A8ZUF3_ARUDO
MMALHNIRPLMSLCTTPDHGWCHVHLW